MVRLVGIGISALVLLSACSSGGAATQAPAPAAPAASTMTTAASSTTSSTTSSSAPAPATSSSRATVAVAAHGQSSRECQAASESLMHLTSVGLKANSGKVTHADADKPFMDSLMARIPADAKPFFDAAKSVSAKLVGLDAAAANQFLGDFSTALAHVTAATEQICR